MADESNSDGLLVIRASRDENGEISARVTHGSVGPEPVLEITSVSSENELVTLVRAWLDRIRA